jgi:tetratricopeptide (TPR) repeat protein
VSLFAVCAGFLGCTPMPDAPQEEQKNPYYRTAKERVEMRDYLGAVEAFEKAIQLNPNSVLAHFELALIYEQHECDYAAAIYHYGKVLKLRPNGYPADNARVRIPVCKQELAKSEAMGSIMPSLPLQFEKLREDNERLNRLVETQRVQIATFQTQLAIARTALASNQAFIERRWPATPPGTSPAGNRAAGGPPLSSGDRSANPPAGARVHKVREGDTLASVARLYHVRLDALTAANPSVNPKRLKVGQALTLPGP